jgi:hypothetical protein
VQEFDGVFDGDDVIGPRGVDAVDHGRERGGFARAGRPGDEDQSALLLADIFDDVREIKFFDGANLGGNDAQDHADVAALLEYVDAKSAQTRDAIGHVQFGRLLEFLLLAIGHHAERHGKHFFRSDARHIGERIERAVHAKTGMVADLQVEIGGLGFNGAAQKIVDAQRPCVCLSPKGEALNRT